MATLVLYLCDEAVVAELALQHLILEVEVAVLGFHLLLFEFGKFLEVFVLLQEGFGVEVVVGEHSGGDGDECHDDSDDDEEGAVLLSLLFCLYVCLFVHVFWVVIAIFFAKVVKN